MAPSGIACRRDLAPAQRVAFPYDADKVVAKKCPRTQFRIHRLCDDASLQIDASVAKWSRVAVRLRNETKSHTGRFVSDARNELRSEVFDEAITGSQRERPGEPAEIELFGRAQDRFSILHDLTNPLAEFERARCRDQSTSGPDE